MWISLLAYISYSHAQLLQSFITTLTKQLTKPVHYFGRRSGFGIGFNRSTAACQDIHDFSGLATYYAEANRWVLLKAAF
jgi:hypothetical protein